MSEPERRGRVLAVTEVACATLFLVLITRVLMAIPGGRHLHGVLFLLVAIYLPLLILWRERRRVDFVEVSAGAAGRAALVAAAVALIVFPPFLGLAHLWFTWFFGLRLEPWPWLLPGIEDLALQLIIVALPEEFFFRGYVQGTLDQVFGRPWRLAGTEVGWGWVLTAICFATSHSLVAYQWWHFAIVIPGLLFGWLRARTGGLIAPILIHAASNLVAQLLAMNYRS